MEWQRRREALDLRQSNVARAAGISRTALSLIENGHIRPSVRTRARLEHALDPFSFPIRLFHPGGCLEAARTIAAVSEELRAGYALTLDVAAWLLTRYQIPATAWTYVESPERWPGPLRRLGTRASPATSRANLVLLRAPVAVLKDSQEAEGLRVVSPRRLIEDGARSGGRHGLDAARVYFAFPEARGHGLRLDPDAVLKVGEEVHGWR